MKALGMCRTISAITPEVYNISAMAALNSSLLFTEESPNMGRSMKAGLGQNTRQIKIQNSKGVLRKTSIYTTEIHFSTLAIPLLQ